MRRNQKEEDLRENHPYFDRPLFAVPRESKFRRLCQRLQNARYDYALLKVRVGNLPPLYGMLVLGYALRVRLVQKVTYRMTHHLDFYIVLH